MPASSTQGLATCVHVCCSHPFIYFPAFYTVKSLVERQPHPLEHAYDKWRNEIWDSCKALWCLWVPGQLLNFAIVPRYLRVPFGALLLCVSTNVGVRVEGWEGGGA